MLLRVEGLISGYGRIEVLHGVSFNVAEGEVVSLLGANGAGKTTTMRAVSGLLPTWKGVVEFDGKVLKNNVPPDRRARMGLAHLPENLGAGHDAHPTGGQFKRQRHPLGLATDGGNRRFLTVGAKTRVDALDGDKGQVFTLNYDLLLYWTLMHDDMPFGEQVQLERNDGFGNDEDDPDADYVVWQGETGAHSARIHFLHGALHLFDSGNELKKYTWVRKNIPLIEQARDAINNNAYPLFVAEGTSAQKKDKIRHNAYLYQGFKQLTANAGQGKHCFFIFGHSLAENDDHILKRLARGRFPKLYVGIYGDPNSKPNQWIVERANSLAGPRLARSPLEVAFFDAASAKVWG